TMARLQNHLAGQEGVALVTITVDPDRDDLKDLREYAEHFGADAERWLFLTGKRAEIYPLCITGFRVGVSKGESADAEVTHSTRLVLVDRHGHHRGFFEGQAEDPEGQPVDDLPRLEQAIAALLREPS